MDLLGSILNSMDKPPTISDKDKQKMKKAKEAMIVQQNKEKEKLRMFREKVQTDIEKFLCNKERTKLEYPTMDRIFRTIIHEVAEDAGMVAISFGIEGIDRYIIVYKKEFVPGEDELNALKNGEEWNEEKAKQLADKRKYEEMEEIEAQQNKRKKEKFVPASNYQDKYQHIIGSEVAKDAARRTETNRNYGFVPSENKKDLRSIEQTLADIRSKKMMKENEPKSSVS